MRHRYASTFSLGKDSVKDNVERVVQSEMSKEKFIEQYERPCKPCVIVGAQDNWLAAKKWTVEVCTLAAQATL